MSVNENKICFIICVNDDFYFEECVRYIGSLNKPEGIEIQLLEIKDAKSMTAGYNEGMRASDAKYKVYLHQDVFIRNRYFIFDIINIFKSNNNIGMMGLIGCEKIPEDGIMWHCERVREGDENVTLDDYRYNIDTDSYWNVEAIDGLLMATQYDFPWREDLFDGWDFYDISQSYEMRKRGYSVVVPRQNQIWYVHADREVLSLWNYNKYRQLFLQEYENVIGRGKKQ